MFTVYRTSYYAGSYRYQILKEEGLPVDFYRISHETDPGDFFFSNSYSRVEFFSSDPCDIYRYIESDLGNPTTLFFWNEFVRRHL